MQVNDQDELISTAYGPVHLHDAPAQVARDGEAYSSGFVEITGLVQPDNSVQEYKYCAFGDDLDMDSYNQMVQLSHGQYKHLFMA